MKDFVKIPEDFCNDQKNNKIRNLVEFLSDVIKSQGGYFHDYITIVRIYIMNRYFSENGGHISLRLILQNARMQQTPNLQLESKSLNQ